MSERIVVLYPGQPMQFLIDACGVLADTVNQAHAWRASDEDLVDVYAEVVCALARLRRAELARRPGDEVRIAVIDHLLERYRQTRTGEVEMRVADVVDRLHAEAVTDLAIA
jgi:hypothetical protein